MVSGSGNSHAVTNQNAISDSTPDTIRPRYSAGITFFMPGRALTNITPMMDAMIDTPPSTNGYMTAAPCAETTISAPSAIVAISVTA